jgi:hypothetical protein
MAKASINFQVATGNSEAHMFRLSSVSYLLENETSTNEFKKYIIVNDFLEEAKIITKEKTKRAMQKLAIENFIQEAVLNIKKETSIEDVEKLFKKFNEEFKGGFEVFSIALHKDEGVFIDSKYKIKDLTWDSKNLKWFLEDEEVTNKVFSIAPGRDIFYDLKDKKWYKEKSFKTEVDISKYQKFYNYHSHILFTKFDKTKGKNVRLSKSDYSKIQDITAEHLDMQRGDKWSKNKRMTHWQRKDLTAQNEKMKKEFVEADNLHLKEKKEDLATINDLKKENTRIRKELKDKGAKREDWANYEELYKNLKIESNQDKLTIISMKNQLTNLTDTLLNKNIQLDKYSDDEDDFADMLDKTFEILELNDIKQKEELQDSNKKLTEAHKTILEQKTSISILNQDKMILKQSIEDLEVTNKHLEFENGLFKKIFTNLNNFIEFPQTTFSDIFREITYGLKKLIGIDNISKQAELHNELLEKTISIKLDGNNTSESSKNSITKQQSEATKNLDDSDVEKNKNKRYRYS